jgi:aryl-alcohol dehydrogenase-like predicted oxidoreductase
MKFKEFGTTGMRVSEIGFGGSRIGGVFAGRDSSSREALHVLRKALDSGITFYDTADIYAQGESESLLGKAFQGRRDQVVIATKGGYCLPARHNVIRRIKPLVRPIMRTLGLRRSRLHSSIAGSLTQDHSPLHLKTALEGSLRRLRTDYVDLYQLHSPSTPFMQEPGFGEALDSLERLRCQGKLRFYGIATEVPQDAASCVSAPGISSIQLGFGLLDLEAVHQGTLAAAAARGLGVIARGCFAGGLLNEERSAIELSAATPKWQRVMALRSLCAAMGRSVLDSALQFCRATPAVSVTLLGMRNEAHLRHNLDYARRAPLSQEEYMALLHSADADHRLTELPS